MAKRNKERELTAKLSKRIRKEGYRSHRFPDDSNIHYDYDWFLVDKAGTYCPSEAKYKKGGKKYSSYLWFRDQPHQYSALKIDFERICNPFFTMFWHPHSKRNIELRIVPFPEITFPYIAFEDMHFICNTSELEKTKDKWTMLIGEKILSIVH